MNVSEWYKLNKPNLDAFDLKLMMEYLVSNGLEMPKDWQEDNDNKKADIEKIKADIIR